MSDMRDPKHEEYDVVIVGAGIAGGLVALELARNGKRVLILEAGRYGYEGKTRRAEDAKLPLPPDRAEYMENFFMATAKTPNAPYPPLPSPEPLDPQPDPAHEHVPRATNLASNDSVFRHKDQSYLTYEYGSRPYKSGYERVGGGTTWHWSATAVRLFPNDFRMQDEYGDEGRFSDGMENWPVGYDDVLPFYNRANRLIGVAGSREVDEELGLPFDEDYPMPPVPKTLVDQAFEAANGLEIDGDGEVRVTITPQGRNTIHYPDPKLAKGDPALERDLIGVKRRVCAGNTNCIPICPIQAKYDATVTLNDALDTTNSSGESMVEILPQSVAEKVLVDPNGRVEGIQYLQWEKEPGDAPRVPKVAKGKIYVLAAHAIENPKLLLNSASDALPQGVANSGGKSHDNVGRYLMDHVMYLTWALTRDPVWPFRGPVATSGIETLRDGPFRRHRSAWRIEIGNEGWQWAKGDPYTSVIDFVDGLNSTGINAENARNHRRLFGHDLYQKLNHDLTRQVRMGFLLEQDPVRDMRVMLDPDDRVVDGLGIRRPMISGYGISEYTKRGFLSAEAASKAIWERMGATHYPEEGLPDKPNFGREEYDRMNADAGGVGGACFEVKVGDETRYFPYYGAGHIMGTHRMGTDPRTSVLNHRQQSWDHDNLFMVGSGVFPTTATANPTLTIAALALMAAENVLHDLAELG